MKKSLASINEIIKEVERNVGNSQKLKELCDKLQDNLQYVEKDLHYHYKLFLVEIYGTKLQQTSVADKICREVLLDPRAHVKVQAILRLSYLYSIENRYEDALRQLRRVLKMADKDQHQLEMIIMSFFHRLMESSRETNILKGLKCENDNNYHQALQSYSEQFDCQEIFGSDDNRFFAAKSIKRFQHVLVKDVRKTDLNRFENFLTNFQAQNGDSQEFDKRYHDRKKYLNQIIKFISQHQKRKIKEYDIALCAKKILAIFKLQAALNKMTANVKGPAEEMRKSLKDLKNNKISNPNTLNQFVKREFEKYKKANEIIQRMQKGYLGLYFQIIFTNDEQELLGMGNKKQMNQSILKNPRGGSRQIMKPTESVNLEDQLRDFQGSYMIKVNEHSSGTDKRYFYFKLKDLTSSKMKLYYSSKPSKTSKSDDSYEIKGIKAILYGKSTRAFQRSECKQFPQHLCFSLEFKDAEHKNFYVPDKAAYDNWIQVFKIFQFNNKNNKSEKSSKKVEEKSKSKAKDMSKSGIKKTVLFK